MAIPKTVVYRRKTTFLIMPEYKKSRISLIGRPCQYVGSPLSKVWRGGWKMCRKFIRSTIGMNTIDRTLCMTLRTARRRALVALLRRKEKVFIMRMTHKPYCRRTYFQTDIFRRLDWSCWKWCQNIGPRVGYDLTTVESPSKTTSLRDWFYDPRPCRISSSANTIILDCQRNYDFILITLERVLITGISLGRALTRPAETVRNIGLKRNHQISQRRKIFNIVNNKRKQPKRTLTKKSLQPE